MIGTLVFCAFVLSAQNALPAQAIIRGVVVDASGAGVTGARVSIDGAGGAVTDASGRFSIAVRVASATIEIHVQARGFSEYAAAIRANTPGVRIVLQPQGVAESVTVTAARSDSTLGGSLAPGSVLPSSTLLTSGADTVDDALREVPGFSLFRRSSSRIANPTTQGASLRGLSASGASRVLVLADGVPLNDPFGGWVYWDRVPRTAIDRVETVRSGGLYGAEAVAGVVQLFTITPSRPAAARLEGESGNLGMSRLSAYGGAARRGWTAFGSGERMVFDGAPVVREADRGPVDTNAGVDYGSALASAAYTRSGWNTTTRAGWLDEDRANGTPLQRNDTNLWHVAERINVITADGVLTANAYGGHTDYDQSFSAVNQARTAETLTSRQRVPSTHAGGGFQWASAGPRAEWLAGGEFRRVSGTSDETRFVGVESIESSAGGTERDYAAYAQLSSSFSRALTAAVGARGDLWYSDASVGGSPSQSFGLFMPRASLTWGARPWLSLRGSWTNAARTPTLNELYRNFRVGAVLTEANTALSPENASTFDAGALLHRGLSTLRVTAFWTRVSDAITNVTQASGPTLILRRRLNAGVIRARGAELEGEWRPSRLLTFTATAAAYDSIFIESAEPGLVGNHVPQVPRWQVSVSTRSAGAAGVAAITWRAIGPQFDDDRNQFRLDAGQTLDAYVGKQLRALQLYLALENLFDAEIQTGKTPVTTVGLPRAVRGGIRLLLP